MSSKHNRSSVNENDIKKLMLFLEELGWLLSSYPNLDLRYVSKELRDAIAHGPAAATAAVGGYISTNPNKHFLVGVLPRVLTDESLFPTNEDIAEFATTVMNVKIPRFHKKSKYELIGHIVCQTENLNERALSKLVHALSMLTEEGDKVRKIISQRKQQNFGWNAIIQELATER